MRSGTAKRTAAQALRLSYALGDRADELRAFPRSEPRRRPVEYLCGLLSDARHRNFWQFAWQAIDATS